MLEGLVVVPNPNVLLGLERPDDAGVYRLSKDLALVQTVDFFTPIVDDPFTYGRIAATNSLSDVYAMGGTPIAALNIVCFPAKVLPPEILRDVLRGGMEVLAQAGCALIGGHTVDDKEFKYGLAVTGTVHPDRFLRTTGGLPGDVLVLTKPLGTGLIATAHKQGMASSAAYEEAVRSMTTLNRQAAEAMMRAGARACTDVTGFGLLGHAHDVVAGTSLDLEIRARDVPLLPTAQELAERGFLCGGLGRNRRFYEPEIDVDPGVPEALVEVLHDPQTSGGLLVALPPSSAATFIEELGSAYPGWARVIGELRDGGSGRIRIVP